MKTKRLNFEKKLEMILKKQAHVSKCDNGYFFYFKSEDGKEIVKRLNHDDFTELDFAQATTEFGK